MASSKVDEYIIKLQQQASGAAQTAAAMNALEAQIRAEQDALSVLTAEANAARAALDALKAAGDFSGKDAAIRKQAEALAAVEANARASSVDLAALRNAKGIAAQVDAHAAAKRASAEQRAAQAAETAELTKALGPLGGYVSKLGSVASISGMAMSAVLGMVAAIVASTVAAIAGAVAMTKYAIACADAARSQRLLDNAAAGTTARGSELNKVISDVASRVPIAREKVAEFGRALEIAGVTGSRMQTALEAIAAIESVIPGAGGKVESLVERFQRLRRAVITRADLVGTGLAIEDIAAQVSKATGMAQSAAIAALQNGTLGVDKTLEYMRKAIEAKFGKTIAAQMMSLDVQFAKMKANFAALFSGLDLEPLLAGLKTITDLFSQNTVTGRVLKAVMTLVFQPAIDGIAKLAPFARQFFLGFAVGILRMYVALKPLIVGIGQLLNMGGKGDGLKTAFMLGRWAVMTLQVGIEVLLSVVTAAIVAVRVLGAAWDWIKEVYGKLDALGKFLSGLQSTALEAGTNFVMSFVNAITQGIVAAVAAVMQLGAAAGAALKASLGIASPSKVAAGAAENVTGTFADTIDDGKGDTQAAFKGMVKPADAKGLAKSAKAGGGKILYVENLHIGSRQDWAEFRAFMRGEFEFEGAT